MRDLVRWLLVFGLVSTSALAADPLSWGPVVTRTAIGCDAFTPALGPDGHHYTGFGDCRGLTGTFPKLSMGLGRILGGPVDARVEDLPTAGLTDYGNRDSGQKPSSAIVVDGRMYVWVRNYGPDGTQARLKYSDDFTARSDSTWVWSPVILANFGFPVFVQGVPGDYVYIVAHDSNSAYERADRFIMIRVPADQLTNRGAYEFFIGTPAKPAWANRYLDRRPIFTAAGKCFRSGMSYSKARGRYYWWQNTGEVGSNAFQVWSARKPWGPWTRIFATADWDIDKGERGEFPVAWMGSEPISRPGRLHLLFSGGDRLTIREATIAAGY